MKEIMKHLSILLWKADLTQGKKFMCLLSTYDVFSQAIGTEVQEHSALRNNVLGLEEFLFQ
jgi:hypothetical protein